MRAGFEPWPASGPTPDRTSGRVTRSGGVALIPGRRQCVAIRVICVKNKGLRTLLSIGAALAVIYFGSNGEEGGGVTNTILLLSVAAGLAVWYLTRPTSGKPVS